MSRITRALRVSPAAVDVEKKEKRRRKRGERKKEEETEGDRIFGR